MEVSKKEMKHFIINRCEELKGAVEKFKTIAK